VRNARFDDKKRTFDRDKKRRKKVLKWRKGKRTDSVRGSRTGEISTVTRSEKRGICKGLGVNAISQSLAMNQKTEQGGGGGELRGGKKKKKQFPALEDGTAT